MDIIVIGTTAFLPGFALAGVRHTFLGTPENVQQLIGEHKEAIIILDEELTKGLPRATMQEFETSITPVIITLTKDATRQQQRLKQAITGTLGVDITR
jgi:vacuolar-type H+-ATPase subunit F/Vma7